MKIVIHKVDILYQAALEYLHWNMPVVHAMMRLTTSLSATAAA